MAKTKKLIGEDKESTFSYKKNVVLQIIDLAAKEIAGVTSFSSTPGLSIKSFFSKKLKKGISISGLNEGLLSIDVYLNILFGHSVNDVAFRVQENIRRSVESMTEYKVKKVNVHVYGVAFQQTESVYV